jgi:glycosyltransferase involved in cell wall biosynthesis
LNAPRIALVHDWLATSNGGSERVVAQILKVFPGSDVFTLFDRIPAGRRTFLDASKVTTSFLQRLAGHGGKYRYLLPAMPLAIESLDLSSYDLVLSSSHAVAKGVLTGPKQLHICYCHTPIRYAWDLQHQYLAESGLAKGPLKYLAMAMLQYIRMWDYRTASGVDHFIANSEFVARRIQKVYHRESTVIYPPVNVDDFPVAGSREDFYVVVARLVPYKRVGLLLKAFELLPERRLLVIGEGPLLASLRRESPANVTLLGSQAFDSMRDYLQRARAFLYAAEEDFGISIVEAQACGTPVISYGSGGARETVIGNETGVFFDQQTPESVADAIRTFESTENQFSPELIRANAQRFSAEAFRSRYRSFVLKGCCAQQFSPLLRNWAESQTESTAARSAMTAMS